MRVSKICIDTGILRQIKLLTENRTFSDREGTFLNRDSDLYSISIHVYTYKMDVNRRNMIYISKVAMNKRMSLLRFDSYSQNWVEES